MVFFRLLELSGDLEFNPEPKPDSSQSLSICLWNLNSMSAHNYSKISLLTAHISIHDFDIICLFATYLTSTTDINDENLKIPRYIIYRVDHPSDVKRGGVCFSFKTFDVSIGNKKCGFIHLYRTPSQSQDEFHDFTTNLDMNLNNSFNSNPFLTTAIDDFSAKSKKWSDGDRSTIEGSKVDFLTSQFGLFEIIKEPTPILENSSSCIDLIFTTQPNMVLESRVSHSLHQKCHHQIKFSNFNLKVCYQPSSERTIFHYSLANVDHIQQAINLFDRENVFLKTDVDVQVSIFSNTVLDILNNYIPHETKICDDRDPPWMTTKIEELTSQKNKPYFCIKKRNNSFIDKLLLHSLQQHLIKSIENAKNKHLFRISEKLNNPNPSTKCYWSSIKTLLNEKKVPCVPPVYDHNRHVTYFKEKCQLFNSYFPEQCTLLKHASTLPNRCSKHTHNILDTIIFSKEDTYKIIKNLDPNNTHSHNMISIRMIKLGGISIYKLFEKIFRNCSRSGKFPSE